MPDHLYVYPTYLERGASRQDGRRIPATLALENASHEEIEAAARRLGFTATDEPNKQYPRTAFDSAGRVKIQKPPSMPKTRVLRALAEEIRRGRGRSGKP
ncbi:Signal recognition particle, SRP19 subunit [mine drainage metagenome]|uniref:Signal recognition particle, SRP19 subunit n=1 Tax=mine drainage metagenome TaxID=410659 RepID=T0XX44_9ZZZZ